jgi:hypothetical protein
MMRKVKMGYFGKKNPSDCRHIGKHVTSPVGLGKRVPEVEYFISLLSCLFRANGHADKHLFSNIVDKDFLRSITKKVGNEDEMFSFMVVHKRQNNSNEVKHKLHENILMLMEVYNTCTNSCKIDYPETSPYNLGIQKPTKIRLSVKGPMLVRDGPMGPFVFAEWIDLCYNNTDGMYDIRFGRMRSSISSIVIPIYIEAQVIERLAKELPEELRMPAYYTDEMFLRLVKFIRKIIDEEHFKSTFSTNLLMYHSFPNITNKTTNDLLS